MAENFAEKDFDFGRFLVKKRDQDFFESHETCKHLRKVPVDINVKKLAIGQSSRRKQSFVFQKKQKNRLKMSSRC